MALKFKISDANEGLLDRRKAEADVAKHFGETLRVLQDLVDYGTNLIIRCLATREERSVKDAMLLSVLLKQAVTLLDAGHVLLERGAVYASYLQLRALFEVSVYIDWILKSDSESRARAYYVAHLRSRRIWLERTQGGNPEQIAFAADLANLKRPTFPDDDSFRRSVEEQMRELDKLLTSPRYRSTNQRFIERRSRQKHEPLWYLPLYPPRARPSLRTLASEVERLAEYRIIYEQGSEVMHASCVDQHITVSTGKVVIRDIRELTNFGLISNLFMGEAIHTSQALLAYYRPEERFAEKYVDSWRSSYLRHYSIQYLPSRERLEL